MRRCSSLHAAWRALLSSSSSAVEAAAPLASPLPCGIPTLYSTSSSSSSSSSGILGFLSPLHLCSSSSSGVSSSSFGCVRWYARHPRHMSLRRANIAASKAAVMPFLEPDPNAPPPAPKSPPIPTALPPLPQLQQPQHYTRIGRITGPYKVEAQAAFAVVELGCSQYKVTTDDVVFTPKLKDVDINDVLLLNKVLLTGTPEATHIGRPFLPGASVVATVEEHFKDAKVLVFKKKPRKRYSKLKGHRSHLTALRILQVRLPAEEGDAIAAAAAAAARSLGASQQQQQQQLRQ